MTNYGEELFKDVIAYISELEAENKRLDEHSKHWGLKAAKLEAENERLLIELDDISKQAAKELTGEAIQARVKITMEAIAAAREVE